LVHILGLSTATISPDERYLAALIKSDVGAEVQVWDFRSGNQLLAHALPVPQGRPIGPQPPTYIRYTNDGQLLAVYLSGDMFFVLRASDLSVVRTIRIKPDPNPTGLETSPADHRVAIRISGEVRIYDLDSGGEIRSWSVSPDEQFEKWALDPHLHGAGIAWNDDGKTLAISVADNPPCLRGGGTIYVFDLLKEKATKSFRVKFLPSAVAFGSGNNLYIASNTCGGYFSHWTLDLPIVDVTSGRETGRIPAGKVGIRNYIAVSTNKQFLLAHADRQKTTLEGFEDTVKIEDAQWQVWNLAARKLVLVLPSALQGTNCSYDSLSNSGLYAYGSGKDDVCIFPLPPVTQ